MPNTELPNTGFLTNGNGKIKGLDITNSVNYLRTEPLDLLDKPEFQTSTGYQTLVTTSNTKPGLIYSKMSQVMKDIAHVSKNQTNTMQGFKFRGIDQFINALYPALTKHGVFMVPELEHETHELREVTRSNGKQGVDKHVHIRMSYTFYAEDGSYVTAGPIPAESVDSGDKATNKALSAALKYTLIQTFSIPTEDMAEGDLESPEIGIDVKTPVKAPNSPATRSFTPPVRNAVPTTQIKTNLANRTIDDKSPSTTQITTVITTNPPTYLTEKPVPVTVEPANAVQVTTDAATIEVKKVRGKFSPPKREVKPERES